MVVEEMKVHPYKAAENGVSHVTPSLHPLTAAFMAHHRAQAARMDAAHCERLAQLRTRQKVSRRVIRPQADIWRETAIVETAP